MLAIETDSFGQTVFGVNVQNLMKEGKSGYSTRASKVSVFSQIAFVLYKLVTIVQLFVYYILDKYRKKYLQN